jgi:predicted DNA-binding protein
MQFKMRKDTALSFRVPSALKEELQALAMKEGRSIAQVCEAFMRGGLETYKKEGSKYLQRFLSRRKDGPA